MRANTLLVFIRYFMLPLNEDFTYLLTYIDKAQGITLSHIDLRAALKDLQDFHDRTNEGTTHLHTHTTVDKNLLLHHGFKWGKKFVKN